MLPLDLSFCVLRVTLRALEPVQLPCFPGSKLEGAFGRALYRLACTQPQRETCQGCPLQSVCPYGLSYAPRLPEGLRVSSLGTPPRPVIFRVAYAQEQYLEPGEALTFGLVVVGRAAAQLPYLLAALRDVGRGGLGRTGGRLELEEVSSAGPYTNEEVTLLRGAALEVHLSPIVLRAEALPLLGSGKLRLQLRSPLHIKAGGEMAEHLHFSVLVRALQRRMSNLEQVHGGAASLGADFTRLPRLAHEVETVGQRLCLVSQLRKGSRPRQTTKMEGWVGSVEYRGDFAPFASLLRCGEQLGVGKWAHFGAGLYDLEVDDLQVAG